MRRVAKQAGRSVRGVRRVWVIGSVLLASVVLSATSWSQSLTWLGTLPGYEYMSGAQGVSADGSVVVGWAVNASYQLRAFRWTAAGGMQDLGTLGGLYSQADGVSADGSVVVGYAVNTSGQHRAFRWTNGVIEDLGTLGGDSYARGVSADGSVVVGWAVNASGEPRAFRWTAQSGIQDLNQLYAPLLQNGSVLSYAYAISPDGRYIVGQGRNAATGRSEAFLLDTVPEPASLMVLGAGLAGLLSWRRRRQ